MQAFSPSIDYIQHYTSGNFYEPPQTRRRNPYESLLTSCRNQPFESYINRGKAKILTSASLAKSHFEPLCLTYTLRANTAIWLAHPMHHPL